MQSHPLWSILLKIWLHKIYEYESQTVLHQSGMVLCIKYHDATNAHSD